MDAITKTSFVCDVDHSFRSIIHGEFLDDDDNNNCNNPYRWAFIACNFVVFLTFSVSSATGNMSQVDKLWSILPTIYAWMCVADSRTLLMATLSTLWSIRLSYNFYRRGGYTWPPWQGEEDYRWECLRSRMLGGWWTLLANKYIWILFNIFFISLFQNYLLLFIASPSFISWSVAMKRMHCQSGEEGGNVQSSSSLNMLDVIATALFLTFLLVEAMADNQQVKFQNGKKLWKESIDTKNNGGFDTASKVVSSRTALGEYKDGFCQSGLFAIVRKPAYASEQGIWISYYLFSVAARYSTQGSIWNWSGGGFVLLCILFQGSGWLTEQISMSKYPAYRDYKKRVPLYWPKLSSIWKLGSRDKIE